MCVKAVTKLTASVTSYQQFDGVLEEGRSVLWLADSGPPQPISWKRCASVGEASKKVAGIAKILNFVWCTCVFNTLCLRYFLCLFIRAFIMHCYCKEFL